MKEQQSLDKIRQFVKKRYADAAGKDLRFHTFERCRKLVKAVTVISGPLHLSSDEQFILSAAAWLHDIGYTETPMDHESAGQRISGQLLSSLKIEEGLISRINELLMITPGFHEPLDLLEEIMSDAGTSYLAKHSFFHANELQRKEQAALQAKKITKAEWAVKSICWITDHHYFTETARNLLEEKKQRNLAKLKNDLLEVPGDTSGNHELKEGLTSAKTLKKHKSFPEKGIDTMFRIASANNQRISAMADNKSRILITVNAIILSAIISLVLKKLDQDTYLAYPTFLLIGVSLVSIVFAILAIRPHETSGVFTEDQLKSREVNMLFYGNFHQMGIAKFRAAMTWVMEDNVQVYDTLIDDLHGQGAAVGRKYRLLRVAYTVFMFGLVITMLGFIIATVIHYHAKGPVSAILIDHLNFKNPLNQSLI